jgi:hypothetical protein
MRFIKLLGIKLRKRRETSVKIIGLFIVKQPGRKPIITGPNHIVNDGLEGILRHITWTMEQGSGSRAGASASFVIGFGSDTVTPTTATGTILVTPVSYKPDSTSVVGVSKETEGQFRAVWRAIWNANHFGENKTLGEIGLHLNAVKPSQETDPPTKYSSYNPANYFDGDLISRVSVADGDFSTYTVDYTKPLTIEYWIRMTMS